MEIQSVSLHYRLSNIVSLCLFIIILFLTGASIRDAQTLQNGIYTEAQAARGAVCRLLRLVDLWGEPHERGERSVGFQAFSLGNPQGRGT